MQWLKRIWTGFVEFNRERLIPASINYDAADHRRNFDASFDSAKRLSDFIGMVVRLAFVAFAAAYFYTKSRDTKGLLGFVFGYCAVCSIGLGLALGRKVLILVYLWDIREIPVVKGRIGKFVIAAFGVATVAMIYVGCFELIKDMAAKTAG